MIFRHKEREIGAGDEVLTSDEEHLGAVTAVDADALEVTGGTLEQVPLSCAGTRADP